MSVTANRFFYDPVSPSYYHLKQSFGDEEWGGTEDSFFMIESK